MTHVWIAAIRHGEALHVLAAPDGDLPSMRPLGVFTPDWDAVREAGDAVRSRVRHAADVGTFDVDAQRDVRLHGGFLFDELLPFEAKTWLRDGHGVLTLSLSPDLLGIPWELLHTGRETLSHAWAIGRVIQQPVDVAASARRPPTPTPRVLIVADPDGALDESYAEGVALQRQLRDDVDVTLRSADVAASFVRRHVRAYDVVHFAGHVDERGWRMSESWLGRDDVERLIGGGALPRLLFVNGCGATRADGALPLWLRGGVAHVLGPLYDVPDRLGRDFAAAFYRELVDGVCIGEAVRRARVRLARQLGDGATPWGSYVLYGDPSIAYADDRALAEQTQPIVREAARPTVLGPRATPSAPEPVRHVDALPPAAAPPVPHAVIREWVRFGVVLALILATAALAAAWITHDGPARDPFGDTPTFDAPAAD